jgi:hypothetical protein
MLTSIVRAAWLGAAIGWVYIGLRRHRVLLLAVPLTLVALLYLPGSLSTPALSGNSLGQRTSTWSANLSHLARHPLGSGIGSTGAAAVKTAALLGSPEASIALQPDNYYYKEVYELGIPGLYFLVLLFIATFSATARAARLVGGSDGALALGVSASVLAAAIASVVSTYFEIYPMDLTFYLLAAVIATYDPGLEVGPTARRERQDQLPGPRLALEY